MTSISDVVLESNWGLKSILIMPSIYEMDFS